MKILGVDHVAINVRDLDAAVKFYGDAFGLKITDREPSKPGIEYFLDCGPSLIGLIQTKDFDNAHPFAHEGLGANHFSFRIHSKDFDATIERFKGNNIKIEYAKKRPRSWSLYFYDLDGNKLEITAWPQEDGFPEEKLIQAIYDPQKGQWEPY